MQKSFLYLHILLAALQLDKWLVRIVVIEFLSASKRESILETITTSFYGVIKPTKLSYYA
jgi:hypothetical protein